MDNGTCSSAVISEIILSEKIYFFYVAAGNEPRPLSIGQDSFVTQINSSHQHPPV